MSGISAEHVFLEYTAQRRGGVVSVQALSDVTLTMEDGEFVCIVGPSGCGKTTFLKVVAGLLQPTSGRVFVGGQAVAAPGPHLGFVFQNARLFPWRTVLRNIAYGLELAGVPKATARDRAAELATLVGLGGFEEAYPHELSGGMQQRVNLARALALDPRGLLLDEPFSALDAQTRELMQEEVERVWWDTKKTALMVTHDISEAVYFADRVVIFSARPGRIRDVVAVPIPHPRPLECKKSIEFRQLEDHVWSLIQAELRENWRTEGSTALGRERS